MGASEYLSFLAGSENRPRLLRTLSEERLRPAELVDAIDASRTAVQRNLAAMRERGWVEKECGRYRTTPAGEHVVRAYESFRETIETIEQCGELLERLPDCACSLDPAWLADARVTVARPAAPYAPIERLEAAVEERSVEHFRGVSPLVSRIYNEVHAPLVASSDRVELVIDEASLAAAREEYPSALAESRTAENLEVYVSPCDVELGLSIFDGYAVLGAYEDGRIQGCIESGEEGFVAWCEDLFERYRADADRLVADDAASQSRPSARTD